MVTADAAEVCAGYRRRPCRLREPVGRSEEGLWHLHRRWRHWGNPSLPRVYRRYLHLYQLQLTGLGTTVCGLLDAAVPASPRKPCRVEASCLLSVHRCIQIPSARCARGDYHGEQQHPNLNEDFTLAGHAHARWNPAFTSPPEAPRRRARAHGNGAPAKVCKDQQVRQTHIGGTHRNDRPVLDRVSRLSAVHLALAHLAWAHSFSFWLSRSSSASPCKVLEEARGPDDPLVPDLKRTALHRLATQPAPTTSGSSWSAIGCMAQSCTMREEARAPRIYCPYPRRSALRQDDPAEERLMDDPRLHADNMRLSELEKLSPDIRALMMSASAKTLADRSERRAAARSRAEAARRNKSRKGQAQDGIVLAALVVLITLFWAAAGMILYLERVA